MKKIIFIIIFGLIGAGVYFSGGHEKIGEMFSSEDDEEEYAAPPPIVASVVPSAPVKLAREYWEKPGFDDWSKYKKVMFDRVSVSGNTSALSTRDQQMLGSYFANAMKNAVQRRYRVVKKAGPDVLRVQTAIADISSVGLANKGTVTMRGSLLDSVSGDRLVTIKDSKSGSLFSSNAIWGDITQGFDNWAQQLYGLLSNKLGDIAYESPSDPAAGEILEMLTKAERHLFSNKLTSPPGRNALEGYRQVLLKDPDNKVARKGIEKIVKKYASWGERAIMEDKNKRGWFYLDKARDIDDEHPAVKRLENALRGGGLGAVPSSFTTAPVAAPPPVATPEPTPEQTPEPTAAAPAADGGSSDPAPTAAPDPAPAAAPAATPAPASTDPWGGAPGKGSASFSGKMLKPFMLGLDTNGDVAGITAATKKRLTDAGFEIVGEYAPFGGTHIVVVTNGALKTAAGQSKHGGYGAAVRVSISQVGERIQVSYVNPIYMQNIYRMKANLSGVATKLGSALGHEKVYGSKAGVGGKDLRKWHYMFGMPYFDDADKIGKGGSYDALVSKIDAALTAGKGGLKKVFRIDIPGKKETIFGVGISQGAGGDGTVMSKIDVGAEKHAPHLPYEILVSGKEAYALNGKFRIALSFPDLTMGQFASIKSAPGGIEDALTAATK